MRYVVNGAAGLLLALAFGPPSAMAQSAADTAVVPDTGAIAVEDSAPAKKGGLWGKAKKVAGNKVVKAVAKTAACTMVPGGQAIAGAIDAASAKSASEAAQGAAGAATGTSCMPAIGGAAGAAGAAGAMPGGLGMMPSGMDASGAGGGMAGAPGASGPDMAAVQQMIANAQAAQQRMGPAGAPMPGGMEVPGMEAPGMGVPPMGAPGMGATGSVTEAPGQMPKLAADPAGELAKGKTAVRSIDWMANGGTVSPAAQAAFDQAIATLAKAMAQAGGKYRLELYMDDRYNDLALKMYGPPRLQLVRSMLDAAQPDLDLQIGKARRNNDARLEIVRK